MTWKSNSTELSQADRRALFEACISATDQVLFITNNPNNPRGDSLQILYANTAFIRLTGYAEQEAIGHHPSLLYGPGSNTDTLHAIDTAIRTEKPLRCEVVYYSKTGTPLWFSLHLIPARLSNGHCRHFIHMCTDLTQGKTSGNIAIEKEETLSFVLDSAGLGYWDLDLIANRTTRSLKHDQIFGHTEMQDEWSYATFLSHVHRDDKDRVDSAFQAAMSTGGDYDVEFRCEWPDRSLHWLWSKGRFITNEQNEIVRASGIQADITDKKVAEEKIYQLAYVDELTQLPNRSAFNERFREAIETTRTSGAFSALIFLDLDDFKLVNDTLGHHVGDLLLISIATRLKNLTPGVTMICRFGGDEFGIIVDKLESDIDSARNQILLLVTAIQQLFEDPFYCNSREFYCHISLGITLFDGQEFGEFDLLKQADLALYKAKEKGKNTYQFYDESLFLELVERVEIERELRDAIDNDQLFLMYQPKVDIDGMIVGLEALIRWNHPSQGVISPSVFIPVAEDSGLIVRIGEWVHEQAIAFMNTWPSLGIPSWCVLSINISPKQFEHTLFAERFTKTAETLLPGAGVLRYEVTENTVLENPPESVVKMRQLIDAGASFSLDDFGSGYSSLNYLNRLPITELKIDRSFIEGIVNDKYNQAVLSAVIDISEKLDLELVVEGVETHEQVDFLNFLGAEVYQGFYFSKPLLKSDAIRYIMDHLSEE